MAKYLEVLAEASAGRGISKAVQSPAELRGYQMGNPKYFGMDTKEPVPYDMVLGNAANLKGVAQGFQEIRNHNGIIPNDAGNLIASA